MIIRYYSKIITEIKKTSSSANYLFGLRDGRERYRMEARKCKT